MAFLFIYVFLLFVFIKFVCTTSITSVYHCVFQFVCFLIHATLHFSKPNLHSHFQLTVFCLSRFFLMPRCCHICILKPFDSPVQRGLASHYDCFSLSLSLSLDVSDLVSIFMSTKSKSLGEQLLLSGKSLGEQLFSSSLLGKI